jgi:hypothetical protein
MGRWAGFIVIRECGKYMNTVKGKKKGGEVPRLSLWTESCRCCGNLACLA